MESVASSTSANLTRLRERFDEGVLVVDDPDACWPWQGSLDKGGYGQITMYDPSAECGFRTFKVHRLAWLYAHGAEPQYGVCHTCDYRRCARPSHLFDGDARANNRDMTLKCRNVFQHRNPSKKLSVIEVFGIKLARLCGSPLKDLAARYNVRESTISRIATGVRRGGHTWLQK